MTVGRVDLPADPGPDETADLRAALLEAFDPDQPSPDVHRRPDVDEMRMLASWLRSHESGARQVRWSASEDADALAEAVLAEAAEAAGTSAPADR